MAVVRLFFDAVGAPGWFAFEALRRYRPRWNFELQLRPCLIGYQQQSDVLFKKRVEEYVVSGKDIEQQASTSDDFEKAQDRRRVEYMIKCMQRQAAYWGLPLSRSAVHQTVVEGPPLFDCYVGTKLLVALQCDHTPDALVEKVVRELFIRRWQNDAPPTTPNDYQEILTSVCNWEPTRAERLLKAMASAEVEQRIIDNEQEAIDNGAYALPWIVASPDGKLNFDFFGPDHLPIIADIFGQDFAGPLRDSKEALN